MLKLADIKRDIFSRVRRRVLKIPKKTQIYVNRLRVIEHIWEQNALIPRIKRKLGITRVVKKDAEYQRALTQRQFEEIVSSNNLCLTGFFADFGYIKNIEGKVRSVLTFKNPLDERNQAMAKQMEQEVSVSIHVRRGDYLTTNAYAHLEESYYVPAMSYFTDRFGTENVHFYCFSDDIPWCRQHFKAGKITFVDWNTGDDSWRDIQLMSLCKHNIIANSSFSIWGAWLNANSDKIVIRPKVFSASTPPMPKEWVVLDN